MQVKLQIPKVILYVGNFVNKSFDILKFGFIKYGIPTTVQRNCALELFAAPVYFTR